MIVWRFLFAFVVVVLSAPLHAQDIAGPTVERGALDGISDWITYDFHTCTMNDSDTGPAECLSAAVSRCVENYFYRHCLNNADSIGQEWAASEMAKHGQSEDFIEKWFHATSSYCALLFDAWMTQPHVPPSGLAWDNSVVPCRLERMFEILDWLH